MTASSLSPEALDLCYSTFCKRAGGLSEDVQPIILARFALLAMVEIADEARILGLIDAALEGMSDYRPIPQPLPGDGAASGG